MPEILLSAPRAASATPYPQRHVSVHGLRLRYVDVPARAALDDASVVLIHGLASRLEEYAALMTPLGARRRVLAMDLPGCGYSDKPNRRYDFRFFEDAVLGFLDAIDVREPVHLAGGSLGACLALRLAHREPERFARLAVWAPGGSWSPKRWTALGARVMRHLPFAFWPTLRAQSRFWYHEDWAGRDEALRDSFAYFREVYDAGFHRMYWEMAAAQVEESLFTRAPEIAQPTYLAYGELDTGLGMNRGVPKLAALMPRAQLRCFPGARHALASERAEELGVDVDRFLRRAPARAFQLAFETARAASISVDGSARSGTTRAISASTSSGSW